MIANEERIHPTLGIRVRSDGQVLIPANYRHKEHWTSGCPGRHGYRIVKISNHSYYVHRLVAEASLPRIESKVEVDHIDRDTSNNAVSNLRWASRSENTRNTMRSDKCFARLGMHRYDNPSKYSRLNSKAWYLRTIASRRAVSRAVKFSDGKIRWLPLAEAARYLQIPLRQRVYT